ncbi:MAG: sensitivity to high expression protein she9 [Thelocarpon superellum]|nr:MAG: sensitivity to high expression protein she9 [Thelocarpon superellum]
MDQAQSNLILASQQLNDLTGYSGIESLKRAIEDQEAHVQRSRASVRAAKDVYTAAIATRSASQREVNELLQRKHAWTPTDLERFTALYRSDHANEHAEAAAGRRLAEAEQAADEQATELTRSILARYHEEQIWSDKIRRMSTWGTWGLMGVNVLLFVLFQVAVEPWRRARLIQGFDDKVRDALEREKLAATAANEEDRPVNTLLPSNAADPASTPLPSSEEGIHTEADADPLLPLPHDPPPPTILAATQVTIADLFSPRVVSLRKVDVTAAVLEGAAAGATFMGIAILLVMGVGRG